MRPGSVQYASLVRGREDAGLEAVGEVGASTRSSDAPRRRRSRDRSRRRNRNLLRRRRPRCSAIARTPRPGRERRVRPPFDRGDGGDARGGGRAEEIGLAGPGGKILRTSRFEPREVSSMLLTPATCGELADLSRRKPHACSLKTGSTPVPATTKSPASAACRQKGRRRVRDDGRAVQRPIRRSSRWRGRRSRT